MSSNMYTSIHGVTSVTVGEISQLPGGQWVREVAIETNDGPILVLSLFGEHAVQMASDLRKFEIVSKGGFSFGIYSGATPKSAFLSMLAKSGSKNHYGEPHVGTEDDWDIREVTHAEV